MAKKKKSKKKVVRKAKKKADTVLSLKESVQEQLVAAVKAMPKVKVFTLKREHFNDKLSTLVGFGFQDLKSPYKELVHWLMNEYNDVTFQPVNTSLMIIDIYVKM